MTGAPPRMSANAPADFFTKIINLVLYLPPSNRLEAEETRAVAVGGGWSGRPGLSAGGAHLLSASIPLLDNWQYSRFIYLYFDSGESRINTIGLSI